MRERALTRQALKGNATRLAPPWAVMLAALLLGVSVHLGLRSTLPSTPRLEAEAGTFTVVTALPLLERLVGQERPHPTGSAENRAVRERLVSELIAAGYTPELQTAEGCSPNYGTCAVVTNVIATLAGRGPGPALVLTAHYDSVTTGPGVADDMAGVAAVLEVARMVQGEPQLENDLIFLFTDGEELGLLGAEVFLTHPLAARVGLVANFEARGSSGQSLLFQTSPGNSWLIGQFLKEAPNPSLSSFLSEVYSLLPNDTDLSVYLRAGIPGLNFAFAEGEEHYHTATDNLAHLDLASFQHHGENALAVVRAFGNEDLSVAQGGQDAVYRDIYPGLAVQFPATWAPWLALVVLILWALIVLFASITGRLSGWQLFAALLLVIVGLALAAAAGFGVKEAVTAWSSAAQPQYANATATTLALTAGGAFAFLFTLSLAARRLGFWALACAVWLLWSLGALRLALFLPGTSIALLPQVGVATLLFMLITLFSGDGSRTGRAPKGWLAALLAALTVFTTAFLTLPFVRVVLFGLGFEYAAVTALLVAAGISPVAPLLAVPRGGEGPRRVVLIAVGVSAAVGVAWASWGAGVLG